MKKFMTVLSLVLSLQAQAAVFTKVKGAQVPKGEMPKVSLPPVESPRLFAGKTVAILASHGVEESEITFPYQYLVARGAQVDVLVPHWTPDGVVASRFLMPTLFVKGSATFSQGQAKRYDLVVLTGGAWNAQVVRTDNDALTLIKNHYERGGPIAAICAGTSVLINAGLAKGLMLTGSPPVRPDLENAGAQFKDQAVVMHKRILTSRTPDDLPSFVKGVGRILAR